MNKQLQQREADLIHLARAVYEAAVHEEDKDRLQLIRRVILAAAALINEATRQDGIFDSDLSLTLILFIDLKISGNPEAEADRKDALRMLEELEAK